MGGHANTRWQNIANVTIVVSIVVCSTFYAITTVFPNLFAAK